MRTKLTKTQKALLASLDRPRTARELSDLTETSRLYTTRALSELVELGLVERTPPTVIYSRAAEASAI